MAFDETITNISNKMKNIINDYTNNLNIDCDEYYNKNATDEIAKLKEEFIYILKKNADLKIRHKHQKFYAVKVDSDISLLLLLTYSIFYFIDNIYLLSKKPNSKLMIGLDFEFNANKIALCQISFFPLKRMKYIFILDPKQLSDDEKKLFIYMIFISPIYRIVHGADSLDLPYIYNELFNNDTKKILKFTESMIDTRFLCEYFKIFFDYTDKKCSIYDALLYFKVISNNTYTKLNKISDSMGHIQDVHWNVYKMSSFQLKYALYDVFYLKKFVLKIFKTGLYRNNELYQQLKYISSINRFICYEKYGVSNILETTKLIIDPINNYIVESHTDDTKKTMITIYDEIIKNIVISSTNMKISKLLGINNFKKSLTLLFKRIVYSVILNKYNVYENKKQKVSINISTHDVLKHITNLKLDTLSMLLKNFQECVDIFIVSII
jgi:hypothetical protein